MQLNNKKLKVILIVFISLVAVSLIVTGIIYYIGSKNNTQPNNLPIENNVNNDVTTPKQEDNARDLQSDIKGLNAKYSDAIAWIKVPNTNIDYPIFQAKDNDRYLRNDRDNNKTKWGEHFLDYRTNINNMDNMSHFIVYGHNTETDDHFTPLLKYKTKEFFDGNKTIEMSTINGNYKWEIFSVYVTNTDFYYIETDFSDKEAYGVFLNSLKAKSMYDTGVNISADDTILTLSTCEYSIANGRLVVEAKLIK